MRDRTNTMHSAFQVDRHGQIKVFKLQVLNCCPRIPRYLLIAVSGVTLSY